MAVEIKWSIYHTVAFLLITNISNTDYAILFYKKYILVYSKTVKLWGYQFALV